jgi:ubiquitin related modifier 1
MRLTVELAGGLHLLFDQKKSVTLEFDASVVSVRRVIGALRDGHLKTTPELFLAGDSVRPGILVLVNEVDWELEGLLDAEVKEGCVGGLLWCSARDFS